MEEIFRFLGVLGAGVMPLFNIPLMLKIHRRKSAEDLSLVWLFGIWSCIVLMYPSTIRTDDLVLKVFGISNLVLFTCVVAVVVYYRFGPGRPVKPGTLR